MKPIKRETFPFPVIASNQSGNDIQTFTDPTLTVLKGKQSIVLGDQAELLTYGDPPLDLNISSTSGLDVSIEVLEGNNSVDLNGTPNY